MVATANVLDLGNEVLKIDQEVIPISVTITPEYQFSKVTIIRRTVLQPNSVGFVKAKLDQPIEGTYIFEGSPSKGTLTSRIYGQGEYVTLKVVNDSPHFVTFKKGSKIGHAESAVQIESPENMNILRSSQGQLQVGQSGIGDQEVPAHLKQIFLDNVSELSDPQKAKFKNLIMEFSDVFSKDDFDLGCLNSGVEHQIRTHDEIPIAEKFRRTPLQFQKQEQDYIEKLLKQNVIEPSVSEWSAAPVLVRKKVWRTPVLHRL
ncbi:MAG: hypothetical protein N0E48_20435 [Candidatus Thiodiazotropha endolucinida]|nr:hypothetical protein [Candidatus Thiodiazotropha taylori]MCW4345701.1 hypothetical protein [Candidatus Thiodiazotropha endolucinida]